ncbi:hypothetical protein ACPPVT_16515 [Angustibacter sp. McL0619]|uniref:hypothetical protein n=1 Tax=Angustibacter sp. McL0619 TaxID=3415676 RepID=UPI003CE91728
MRSFGSPRRWPPEPGQELGGLLGEAHWAGLRRGDPQRLDLAALLVEMEAWVQDSRPYHRRHESGWLSVTADILRLLASRGPRLAEGTPALTALAGELSIGGLGADIARRAKVVALLFDGRGELGETDAMVAAFDDLTDAVTAADSSPAQLLALVDALSCAVRRAGRSMSGECSIIAGVVDDDLLDRASRAISSTEHPSRTPRSR